MDDVKWYILANILYCIIICLSIYAIIKNAKKMKITIDMLELSNFQRFILIIGFIILTIIFIFAYLFSYILFVTC